MSIATQITRLQGVKTDIRNALVEQGVEASTHNMDDFADDILSIQGGSLAPTDMISFTAQSGTLKIILTGKTPSNIVVDGVTILTIKGCYIVMNENHYPTNENDGILVKNHLVSEGNTFSVEATGLQANKQYYFSAFPYSTDGVVNRSGSSKNHAESTAENYVLYGYKRTKSDSNPATRLVATDMAVGMQKATRNKSTGAVNLGDWSDAWFVTGNKPCMMKYDGTIDYYLNPNDLTKKEDGTASDVANTSYAGNAMALFPTCWVKRWEDSNYEYFQACNIQLNSDFKAYAHQREDGSIMDWFARSIFDGANVSNRIRSISGLTPSNSTAGTTQLSYAQNNGELWDCDTWSRVGLIWDLLRLMSLNDDVQEAWGYGYCRGVTSASALKTSGTGNNKGSFYGKDMTDVIKVFNIENFWGNIWKLLQGLMLDSGKYKIKMTRPYNVSGSNYVVKESELITAGNAFQSAHNMSEYGLLTISTAKGANNVYIPDGIWVDTTSLRFARFAGHGFCELASGCALHLAAELSGSAWTFGVALTCEQPK